MGLPNSKVVRVTCHSVSRTVKIPLFESVREKKALKKLANDASVPESIRPTVTSVSVEDIHQTSGSLTSDARAFIASIKPKKEDVVERQVAATQVVLPK